MRLSNNQIKLLQLLENKKEKKLRPTDLKNKCFSDFKSFYRSINNLLSKKLIIKKVVYPNRYDYEITIKGKEILNEKI
ncbi:MAG: hypothetical protein ACP6IY_18925 [Promethearchaeia archaeon]